MEFGHAEIISRTVSPDYLPLLFIFYPHDRNLSFTVYLTVNSLRPKISSIFSHFAWSETVLLRLSYVRSVFLELYSSVLGRFIFKILNLHCKEKCFSYIPCLFHSVYHLKHTAFGPGKREFRFSERWFSCNISLFSDYTETAKKHVNRQIKFETKRFICSDVSAYSRFVRRNLKFCDIQ